MELIPIKTRRVDPPKDNLFAVLEEALTDVREGDVVLISSKIVAIGEGRCIPATEYNKEQLLEQEADILVPRDYWGAPLTVVHHAFIGTAGIDESNAGDYVVLLPEDPFASARVIHAYLKERFSVQSIGVVITDSHSQPMRFGASGISIGFWGINPLENCIGQKDLFGREMKMEKANIVDGLAAGATVVMGEVAQCQPIVIARDVPDLQFTEGNMQDALFVPYADDTFRVLYEKYLKN